MKTSVIHKIAAVLVAMFMVSGAVAQTKADFKPEANTTLTYHVVTPTQQYDFTVIVKTYGADVAFDWVMSGDVNQKGAIAFNNADASDAKGLNNFFGPGALDLTGKTSVWVSKTIYKLLKSNVAAEVTFDNAAVADRLENKGTGTKVVDINGTPTKLEYIKATNNLNNVGGKELWILDDAKNPLIVYMNMGWTIELKSITTQQ